MRLEVFDKFRAIAIIFIIVGHSVQPWSVNAYHEKIFISINSGASSLFVFISGFFFHHVFYNDFKYKKFLIHKFKKIFIPYLSLSVLCFTILPFIQETQPWVRDYGTAETFSEYVRLYSTLLIIGKAQPPYWYIPFITIMFLLSPVFIAFLKLPYKALVSVFLILMVGAMIWQKSLHQMSPLHAVAYFSHMYILGMIVSIKKDKILHYFDNKLLPLGLVIISLSVANLHIYGKYKIGAKASMFDFNGFDILVPQKVILCFFIIGLLNKLSFLKDKTGIMKDITTGSFSLYFLHFFVVQIMTPYISRGPAPGVMAILLKSTFVVLTTLALAKLIKKLLGSKSKYLIGW